MQGRQQHVGAAPTWDCCTCNHLMLPPSSTTQVGSKQQWTLTHHNSAVLSAVPGSGASHTGNTPQQTPTKTHSQPVSAVLESGASACQPGSRHQQTPTQNTPSTCCRDLAHHSATWPHQPAQDSCRRVRASLLKSAKCPPWCDRAPVPVDGPCSVMTDCPLKPFMVFV